MVTDEDHSHLSKREHIARHLGARKIEFISTAVIGVVFAISFAALWDDMLFKLLGRHKRIKAVFIGVANLITAIVVEDFAWFANRWAVPLESDPKGGMLMQFSDWTSMHMGAIDVGNFVIPTWYIVAVAIAALAYYGGFQKHDRMR